MILFDKVNKRYPSGHQAIINLSFELEAGEMAFLTGHSGAGKSTLLKLIMLLERSTSGQLLIDGKNLSRIDRTQIPYYRRNIGVVFQNHQLLFDRNIFDNVALPLFVSGLRPRDVGRRVRAALDKVGLSGKEKMNPIMLSGGEQQRLGIARAVVHKPKIQIPSANSNSFFMCHNRIQTKTRKRNNDRIQISYCWRRRCRQVSTYNSIDSKSLY